MCADTTVEVFQSTGAGTPLTTQAQPSWGPHLTTWRCEQESKPVFLHCHQQCRKSEHIVALMQRVKKRPVSPHVFETDGAKFHYKMPINATTSILNRATGVALTVGNDL